MTSTQTMLNWLDRLNPRNWTLKWKLVVVGLVPALLALGLGALRISDGASVAADLGRSSRLLEVQGSVTAAADGLRQERDDAVLFAAGGPRDGQGDLQLAFERTDDQIEDMQAALNSAGEIDGTTAAVRSEVERGLADLPSIRAGIPTTPTPGSVPPVSARYTLVIAQVDGLSRALLRQVRTPDSSGLTDALTSIENASEALALQHTVLGAAIRSGTLQQGDAESVANTDRAIRAAQAEYSVALERRTAAALRGVHRRHGGHRA